MMLDVTPAAARVPRVAVINQPQAGSRRIAHTRRRRARAGRIIKNIIQCLSTLAFPL